MDTQYEVLAGDPTIVKTKGEEYQAIAAAISASVRTLDNIVDQVDQKSLAMSATRDLAHDVASDIRKATDRYQKTGDALVTYANELERTQNDSRYPARRIAEIEAALVTARYTARVRRDEYLDAVRSGDDAAIETARERRDTADGTVTSLETSLATHQQNWQTAHDEKVAAAAVAVASIVEVTEGKGGEALNDDFWDRLGVVVDVLKVICDIAAILSIFLSWVPVLGQVLLVLAAIGAIIAIVDAAIKFAKGEGSFGQLLLAVVVGVISLYGGKLIGMAAQRIRFSMTRAVQGTGTSGLVHLSGRSSAYHRALNAYPKKVPQGFLGALKSPFVRSIDDLNHMRTFTQATGFKGKLDAAGSVLKEVLKQNNPFNLKSLFKFDSDVADVFYLSTKYAEHFDAALHNKANVVVILEGLHSMYDLGRSGVALTDAITGGDVLGGISTGATHLSGPVPKLVGGGAKLVDHLTGS